MSVLAELQAFLAQFAPWLWIGGVIAFCLMFMAILLGMIARIWS